ncbi:YtxH domain-containing protein [Dyadobacter sp. 32]|uniref:YtxH domain-containing protein n=1 Tax=Dyadobacter sp. 32 TaxID=538966 RepID=UPI0011EF6B14
MKATDRNYEDQESGGAGFATGLLLGAALGACLALLYAPKSGEQTRQELKDLADQQKGKLKDQWDHAKETGSQAVHSVKDKMDSLGDQAKGTVDEYADRAKNQADLLADDTKTTVDKYQRRNDDFGQGFSQNG